MVASEYAHDIQDIRARLIVLDHARLHSHTYGGCITVRISLLRSDEGVGRIFVLGHDGPILIVGVRH